MNLLILNLHYAPDLAPTGQLMTELAEDLARAGLRVTVVTGRPGYTREAAGWETLSTEDRNGVRVHRVWSFRLGRRRMIARVLNYLSFYLSAAVRVLTLPRQDVALLLSSPPFLAAVGILLKRLRGTRMVYNVQDLIPDAIVTTGLLRNRALVAVAERLSRRLVTEADRVVAIGERMAERVVAKGIAREKVTVIHNWADGREIRPLADSQGAAYRRDFGGRPVVLYAGNMGTNHDFETVSRALEAEGDLPVGFLFVGDGVCVEELRNRAEAAARPHVRFRSYVPREELPNLMAAGDIHLICLKDGLGGKVVPSKVYGALAAGRPVLAVAPSDSELWAIVNEAACGVAIRNGDVEGFRAAVARLALDPEGRRKMGENGRQCFCAKYDRPHAARAYRELLSNLAMGSSPASSQAGGGKA